MQPFFHFTILCSYCTMQLFLDLPSWIRIWKRNGKWTWKGYRFAIDECEVCFFFLCSSVEFSFTTIAFSFYHAKVFFVIFSFSLVSSTFQQNFQHSFGLGQWNDKGHKQLIMIVHDYFHEKMTPNYCLHCSSTFSFRVPTPTTLHSLLSFGIGWIRKSSKSTLRGKKSIIILFNRLRLFFFMPLHHCPLFIINSNITLSFPNIDLVPFMFYVSSSNN